MLKSLLKKIDHKIAAKWPKVAAGLRPAASPDALAQVRAIFFHGQDLPEDLEAFFRWHDGQIGYASLSPLDNRMVMCVDDVIQTWRFLSDPDEDIQQPWAKCWIPILANGAGDYIVYVASGEMQGQLLGYWHDDSDRSREFSSLESWAQQVLGSLEKE